MERGVPIRAVSRTIAVLQHINRVGSCSIMDIAHDLKLPYPTVSRIVQTLVYEQLVEREPARKSYRATGLTQTLSLGYRDHGALIAASREHLVELTRMHGWPMTISTAVGTSMMLRETTYGQSPLAFNNYYPGYTFPVLECASGHAHLAFANDDTREHLLSLLEGLGAVSTTMDLFRSGKLVKRIRADGYALFDKTIRTANPGKTSSISVPIFDGGANIAELTLSYFATAMTSSQAVEKFVLQLQEVSKAITGKLANEDESSADEDIGTGASV
ncbi:helix-turn-helix domain-containing protein [Paraburkholderia nemoris]|uniref:helix-turn-helix domain-containing protein n=1 Tax=Paraburkholderia nemoris TaxID=2793076 RepID=UPI0038B92874